MESTNNNIFDGELSLVNKAIESCEHLRQNGSEIEKVIAAENYALSAGGKRIRPILCMEFYRLFGGKGDISDIAICLELMHTFSLIHDDMPEMDNDDFRRGKPSCHIQYGSACALLAGDGLSLLPFEIIWDMSIAERINSETAAKLMGYLAKAAGNRGMIMGQMMDLYSEGNSCNIDFLTEMSSLKTGCILKAACAWGAILAGASDNEIKRAEEYAANLGLAFQIVDDILDVTGDEAVLGKPIGSDKSRNKNTFADILGIDAALNLASEYTEKAVSAIRSIEGSERLCYLANELLIRKK